MDGKSSHRTAYQRYLWRVAVTILAYMISCTAITVAVFVWIAVPHQCGMPCLDWGMLATFVSPAIGLALSVPVGVFVYRYFDSSKRKRKS
jgi:hypothetical protein